ncbi:formyl transferase [Mesorhizobium sp. M1143]
MASAVEKSAAIVIVTEGGPHIWAIVNAIADQLDPVSVILESPESKKHLLLGRARRQGWFSAIGQLGTMVLTRLGKRFFAGHAERLIAAQKLQTEPKPGQKIIHVSSANAADCLQAIADIRPGVVLLAGCRLLSRQTLAQMPCPVLNYHAGIAPKYRGMNGGYWALACGDLQNFGTTVHLVDARGATGGGG